jgi:hypothetical protein
MSVLESTAWQLLTSAGPRSNPGVVRAVAEAFGKPDKLYRDTSWIVSKGADRILTL